MLAFRLSDLRSQQLLAGALDAQKQSDLPSVRVKSLRMGKDASSAPFRQIAIVEGNSLIYIRSFFSSYPKYTAAQSGIVTTDRAVERKISLADSALLPP